MREAAHIHVAVGNRSLFLPGGDRGAGSCSPLEGDCRLRAGKTTQPGPQGSGFFLSAVLRGRNNSCGGSESRLRRAESIKGTSEALVQEVAIRALAPFPFGKAKQLPGQTQDHRRIKFSGTHKSLSTTTTAEIDMTRPRGLTVAMNS